MLLNGKLGLAVFSPRKLSRLESRTSGPSTCPAQGLARGALLEPQLVPSAAKASCPPGRAVRVQHSPI